MPSFTYRVAVAALLVAGSVFGPRGAFADPQADDVKAGAVLFGTSGCQYCHGPAGMGTDRAPSLRDVHKRLRDEQIRHQIHDGGQMMPPFGEALSAEEIAHLSIFLRAKDAWGLVPAPASK